MLWNASKVRKKFEALNLFLYIMEIDDVLNERQTNLKMFLFNQAIFYIPTNYLSNTMLIKVSLPNLLEMA